ncbi:MAG: glucose-inhibited division protein A [Nodularia sp. (in: cyanobacteria)]|nr:glucose-inhibited division protein A [Nodularia sp. (in: cyanobacteria)]
MDRSKIVAVITGAISILLAIAYLILVQLLDYRDMKPAPISQLTPQQVVVATYTSRHGEENLF